MNKQKDESKEIKDSLSKRDREIFNETLRKNLGAWKRLAKL